MKTKQELIEFENWVIQTYKDGKLRSPVHLSGGNEEQVIEVFKQIKPTDWVFSTYRSHYHALLKGIPEEWLKEWILNNKSISVMSKEHKFWTSAIVGGSIPIALGTALAIKLISDNVKKVVESMEFDNSEIIGEVIIEPHQHVWCFIGDMTAATGGFNDALTYAVNFNLPITFIIENNGLSTDTPTAKVWGTTDDDMDEYFKLLKIKYPRHVKYYKYKRTLPHYGVGFFVSFSEDKKDLIQDGTRF